jgi:predicted RNase H-like HicB family nuclease
MMTEMNNKYEIILYWSDTDGLYIAEVPELAGCMAHGASDSEALTNVREAIALWIATAHEFGDAVPAPKGRRLLYA